MQNHQERIPLRSILQHFVNHVESLEIAAKTQQRDYYEEEFLDLKLFSESLKTNKDFSSSEGEKEVNKKKNRYKDILPFDTSRVILDEYAGIPGSDYINANYIKGASGSMAYIASQGPLPHTVNDFWRMIVQCEVKVIVMACNEKESGKHKCENYWVDQDESSDGKQFGMANVRLIKASPICPDFCVRMLKLTYTNAQNKLEERTVCQFHYSAWPDHGVPPLVRPLLDMVRLVRDTQASETLPVLVHCSAGCGRTGTICAIDYVWGLLRAGKLTKDFSLFGLVREMRKQRIAMVQTKEQYILVHQAVRELFLEQLRMIDSHPYENIDCDGCLISSEAPATAEPLYDTIESCKSQETSASKKNNTLGYEVELTPQKENKTANVSSQQNPVAHIPQSKAYYSQPNTPAQTPNQTPTKPRIAKLKSLFEKNLTYSNVKYNNKSKTSVCRSNSLGAVHMQKNTPSNAANNINSTIIEEPKQQQQQQNKTKIVTIVKPVQKKSPAPSTPTSSCSVKRSKSLRLLTSSGKLSYNNNNGSLNEAVRTLSLESIVDEVSADIIKGAKSSSHIEKIHNSGGNTGGGGGSSYDFEILHKFKYLVTGLGIRERRNSFRKAVEKSSQQSHSESVQKYTPKPFNSPQVNSPVAVVKPQRHVKVASNEDQNDSNNNTSGDSLLVDSPTVNTYKNTERENGSESNKRYTHTNFSIDQYKNPMTPSSRDLSSSHNMATPPTRTPKTVSGVKLRNRARDDLALCNGSQSCKVKRHASVMLYRNSLIEDSSSSPHKPLTIWQGNASSTSWSQTPGVDIDQVAASMSLQSDATKKQLNTVIQNIHTRKSKSMDPVYAAIENTKYSDPSLLVSSGNNNYSTIPPSSSSSSNYATLPPLSSDESSNNSSPRNSKHLSGTFNLVQQTERSLNISGSSPNNTIRLASSNSNRSNQSGGSSSGGMSVSSSGGSSHSPASSRNNNNNSKIYSSHVSNNNSSSSNTPNTLGSSNQPNSMHNPCYNNISSTTGKQQHYL